MHKINEYSHYANVLRESCIHSVYIARICRVRTGLYRSSQATNANAHDLIMIVYDDRSPPVRVSIHGAELVHVVDSATLTKGLEQHTTRVFVYNDEIVT